MAYRERLFVTFQVELSTHTVQDQGVSLRLTFVTGLQFWKSPNFTRKDCGIFSFNLNRYIAGNSNADFFTYWLMEYLTLVFAWPSPALESPMPSSVLEPPVLMSCSLLPLKVEARLLLSRSSA